MRLWRFAATGRAASIFAGLWVAFSLFFAAAGASAETALQRLEFVTESGPHIFKVELADSPDERAKGLMFRRAMPDDQGMLFDFHTETPIMMWMKNTYIPLDMVFVSKKGVVMKIAADATPMSEEVIYGGEAYAVIELNAGAAKKIGLKPGDAVRHPAFRN
ncbi:DUF192 domain-containing protein [Methylocystis echinoides]|uniref:DUF192 domain-containing protein n=1 Tax=Methylocystis echinoides TaxID=29468 RepID=UPI00342A9572